MDPESTTQEPAGAELHWVYTPEAARPLANLILAPERTVPVVCVSTPQGLGRPYLDPERAARMLGSGVQVWVLCGAREAWALSAHLPDGLDVYGGAVRVWHPIRDADDIDRHDHPLYLIYDPAESDRVLRQIRDHLGAADTEIPGVDEEVVGVVTAAAAAGARIRLVGDHDALAPLAHLAHGNLVHAADVVAPGQQVRARVLPRRPGYRALQVSLLPFAPEPWTRLAQVYRVGQVVEGVVARIFDHAALIDLMPGASGMLYNQNIAEGIVDHPRDHFQVGDSVLVKILSMDPDARKASLSIVAVGAGDEPADPVRLSRRTTVARSDRRRRPRGGGRRRRR